MNVFDAWLIVVGLAIGAGLAWLVMLDLRRRDDDVAARETRNEAAWIAHTLRSNDVAADPEAVEEVLRLHRTYLAGIPDDQAGSRRRPAWAGTGYDAGTGFDDVEGELEEPVEEEPEVARPTARAAPPVGSAASAGAVVAEAPVAPPAAEDADGEALEPAWADDDLKAAHEALDALLSKAPPED